MPKGNVSYLDKLRNTQDRKGLSRLLGFRPNALTAIIYLTPSDQKYCTFEIPKKNGGTRIIKSPNPKLKKLQTHLANLLYACLAEIEKEQRSKPVSYGFREKRSIADNAKNHKRRRYVLNLDIEDFFPSFNFGRVRGFFLKNKHFNLEEEVATTIAQIACDGKALPQGSPCSPVISELIGQVFDVRLLRFAKKHGVSYSRYADDITFSTNRKDFPDVLAEQDPDDPSIWTLSADLVDEIERAGFKINFGKTRMHQRGSRQMVTGLIVNEKVNIRSEYYRKARAMCDSLFQSGSYFRSFVSSDTDQEPQPEFTNNLNPLEGILSHIYAITQSEERREIADQREHPRAIRTLYRRFLFYKYCIALSMPLIITEGKTDPVYLREAIKQRDKYHPTLGEKRGGVFEFRVQFFNYEGQAHEIMGLRGGTGDLKSIPLDYLHNLQEKRGKRKSFKHKPMNCPVILVLDNDDGLKHIAGTIRRNFNVTITTTSTDTFYHIIENLYLIKTPEVSGKGCIEDLFPKKWMRMRLNGKSFGRRRQINPETEYGKEIFAKSVVKPNSCDIDFSGFDPLLDRIVAVLDDYDRRQGAK